MIQGRDEGDSFLLGDDRVTIKASSLETDGAYSVLHWVVAANAVAPAHIHENYEETFYVLSGTLEFLIGGDSHQVSSGDFIRAPAGKRHGYVNISDEPAELIVTFTPGGMEQLFSKYRTDSSDFDIEGYLAEAKTVHTTEYEIDA